MNSVEKEYTWYYDSPLGEIMLASDGEKLTGLWINGQKNFAAGLAADHEKRDLEIFRLTAAWLDIYFSGRNPDFLPPLKMKASKFRKSVWEVLLTIPYGKTMTYGEIAKVIAQQNGTSGMSAQAVGGAIGHNAIGIIIPCHRVVGTNGSLTGYAGGIEKKLWLLNLEGTDMSRLFIPAKRTAL